MKVLFLVFALLVIALSVISCTVKDHQDFTATVVCISEGKEYIDNETLRTFCIVTFDNGDTIERDWKICDCPFIVGHTYHVHSYNDGLDWRLKYEEICNG